MQITTAQKRRVALFFIAGFVLFIVIIAILVGNKVLKREDCYYTRFTETSVAGLTVGSSVKFQGMNIGHVSGSSIDPEDTSIVQINFCLKPDVPMKTGTVSQLGNIGITGLKFLELKGGGTGKNIPVNGEVPSSQSTWDEITGKASVIATKLETILNNLNNNISSIEPDNVKTIVKNIQQISGSVNEILYTNKSNIKNILSSTDSLLVKVNRSMEDVNKITSDMTRITAQEGPVYKTLKTVENTAVLFKNTYTSSDFDKNIQKVYTLLDSMQKTMDTINLTLMRSQEDITNSFENLSDGMDNFNEFTRIIMENPSSLIRGNTQEGFE